MVQPGVSALGKKNSTTVLPRKSFNDTRYAFWSGKVKSGALSLTCMGNSPGCELRAAQREPYFLYRSVWQGVIFAAFLALALGSAAQSKGRPPRSKGPRALGLLQLAANGKGRIIPIAIMYDGKFYDAAAYKATPVPMALQPGTVYEGFKTGVSQGLFTVKAAIPNRGSWTGEGTWKVPGPEALQKIALAHTEEEQDRPPVLRHASGEAAKPAATPTPTPTATPTPTPSPAQAAAASNEDEHRPVLHRGKQESEKTTATNSPEGKNLIAAPKHNDASPIQSFPAISDEGGPDPHPYSYSMKPDEELVFQEKILSLASAAVKDRDHQLAAQETRPATRTTTKREPTFDHVDLKVFDPSSANEPVLVLSTSARIPGSPTEYFVTLVARQDLYGELHKAFLNITDSGHLDAVPRMELIDAVDTDGDGRGELLFRSYSDAGNAYSIYRVIGNQLYPLYEGALGQ